MCSKTTVDGRILHQLVRPAFCLGSVHCNLCRVLSIHVGTFLLKNHRQLLVILPLLARTISFVMVPQGNQLNHPLAVVCQVCRRGELGPRSTRRSGWSNNWWWRPICASEKGFGSRASALASLASSSAPALTDCSWTYWNSQTSNDDPRKWATSD